MKSIKEKAEEYGYANWQSDEYHDGAAEGLPFDPIGHTQKTFEAGANYVLSVLYDAAYKEDWITNPKDGIRRFFEIYRQLKK